MYLCQKYTQNPNGFLTIFFSRFVPILNTYLKLQSLKLNIYRLLSNIRYVDLISITA